jgi:hypothetical protein
MKQFIAPLILVAVVVTSVAAVIEVRRYVHRHPASPVLSSIQKPAKVVVQQEKEKVYPYSVVPGGAKTVAEAKKAMHDPAVKNHYAAVDFSKLKQVTLTSDLVGYVSYRVGDKIYWTSKKLRIRAGETVFTDGEHVVRGRCLNCYSSVPLLPTRLFEPTEATFDTPVELPLIALTFPKIPLETPVLPPPLEEFTPIVPVLPTSPATPPPGNGRFFPIIPIIPPIHRHHNPPPTVPPTPPVTVVPEPPYVWFLVGALPILIFARWWRSHRSA